MFKKISCFLFAALLCMFYLPVNAINLTFSTQEKPNDLVETGSMNLLTTEPDMYEYFENVEPIQPFQWYMIAELKDGYGLWYFYQPPPPWMEVFGVQYGKYIFANYYSEDETSHGFFVRKDDELLILSKAFERGITNIDEIVYLILHDKNLSSIPVTIIDTDEVDENWKEDLFPGYHYNFGEVSNFTEATTEKAESTSGTTETTLVPGEKPTSADGLPDVVADGEKFYPEVYFGGEVFYAKYTPEKSGAVVIWSYGSTETFRMIYDENMNLLKENSDLLQTNVVDSDGHLGLLYWVDAGKTYIIGVGAHEASHTPEPITVWMDFYYKYTTDPALLPPQQTITDANKLPEIFADGKWRGAQVYHGGNAFYRFTPEQSGTIIIWSSGPLETFRMIYDENMNLLELNSDLYSDVIRDPSGKTASTFDVEAGKTYIIGFGMYEIETRMSFCIEFAEQPTDSTEPEEATTELTHPTTETIEPTTGEVATDPTETTLPTLETTEPTTESTEATTVAPETTEPTTEPEGTTTVPADSTTESTESTTEATESPTESIQPTTSATEQTEPSTTPKVKAKKANKMKVTVKTKTVKVKKLKKGKVTVKAITVKNNNGAVTFKKVAKKSAKCLSINKKTGKITVKKGTKKGTYKINVKITAKGDKNYNSKIVTKTIKIKVK